MQMRHLYAPRGFYLSSRTATNYHTVILGERMGLQPHTHCDKDIHSCTVSPYLSCKELPHSVLRCLGCCRSLRRLVDLLERLYLQSRRFCMGQVHRERTLHEPTCHMGYECWCQHCARRSHLSHAIVHRPGPSNTQITKGRLSGHVCAGR